MRTPGFAIYKHNYIYMYGDVTTHTHTGYQGWSPPELLPVTSGKVLEWDPLRSLKLSKIAALVIGWVTA